MSIGELVMLALAIMCWGTVIALLTIFVRLRRLPGYGYGAAGRRKARARLRPRFLHLGETLPQRH